MSSKSLSQIFEILLQTGDNNTFVLRGVFCGRYVQLKSSFSDVKNISGKITVLRHTLAEKLSKLTWQNIKGKFHHWQELDLCKLIHNAELY